MSQVNSNEQVNETMQENQATAEAQAKYSGRKSFAFSDKGMYDAVEQLLNQKPEGLTNAEFLHQALKQYVESDELNQTFNHLPTQAVDIFKGDLEKLNVAFEMIRETFKTQMVASTQLVSQREDRLTRQFNRERELLDERIKTLVTEVSLLTEQKQQLELKANQATEWKQELEQLKPTVGTLQQALESSQQQVDLLTKERSQYNIKEMEDLKKAHAELKEVFATNNIRLQHAEAQEKRATEALTHSKSEIEVLKQTIEAMNTQHREEMNQARQELATANQTIQELYQKLLKA